MSEQIKAGIFDVGGVLNTFDRHAFHAGIIDVAGLQTPEDQDEYHRLWPTISDALHTGRRPHLAVSERFHQLTGIDLSLSAQPSDSPLTTVFAQIVRPNTETLAVVEAVKVSGLTVAILSDSSQPHASILEASAEYRPFEDHLRVLSHTLGIRKPDPEIYCEVLDRLDVAPEQSFFVDDKEENVQAANALGIHGILFQDARQLRQCIRELGVGV